MTTSRSPLPAPPSSESPIEIVELLRERQRDSEAYMGILFTLCRHHKGEELDIRSAGRLKKALDFFAGQGATARALWIDPVVASLRARDDAALQVFVERFVSRHTVVCDRHEKVEALGRRWLQDDRLDGDGAKALAELLDEIQQVYAATVVDCEQVLLPAFLAAAAGRDGETRIDAAEPRRPGLGQ